MELGTNNELWENSIFARLWVYSEEEQEGLESFLHSPFSLLFLVGDEKTKLPLQYCG